MRSELVRRGGGSELVRLLQKVRFLARGEKKESASARALGGSAAETVDVLKVCAVHDKPFLVSYRRGRGGLFHVAEVKRLQNEGGRGGPSRNVAPVTLRKEEISIAGSGHDCPWCGAKPGRWKGRTVTGVECGGCGATVCAGRTFEGFFRCRDSCGSSGALGSWVDLHGAKRKDANASPAGGPVSGGRVWQDARPAPRLLADGRK